MLIENKSKKGIVVYDQAGGVTFYTLLPGESRRIDVGFAFQYPPGGSTLGEIVVVKPTVQGRERAPGTHLRVQGRGLRRRALVPRRHAQVVQRLQGRDVGV